MDKESLAQSLRKHPRLYYIAKCIRGLGDKSFVSDVNRMNECDLILNFRRNGELHPEKNIYYIENNSDVRGFFSLFFSVLHALSIADKYNLTPVVRFGENTLYYQGTMVNGSMNPFEYFFEPVSEISVDDVEKCARVWYYKRGHRNEDFDRPYLIASQMLGHDLERDEYVLKMTSMMKKYIRFKPEVDHYLSTNIQELIGPKRTLGIHVRGTDFNVGYSNHAKIVPVSQYIEETERAMSGGGFEYIFLATDEEGAVRAFRDRFGEKLLFFGDTLRSSTGDALHFSENDRENHKYLLGLEVLRDAAALSACDGLIAGLSNVSLAARVFRASRDESFDYIRIIDNGFYTKGKKFRRSKQTR